MTSHTASWLKGLVAIAAMLMLAGMVLPVLTLTRLWLFDEQLSIVSGIYQLWVSGRYLLAVLIALFSVLLPLAKLGLLYRLVSQLDQVDTQHAITLRMRRLLQLMHDYGRWAMLDVMVVAMLIVSVKLGVVVSIQVHYGLYIFAAGVLSTMALTHWVTRLLGEQRSGQCP